MFDFLRLRPVDTSAAAIRAALADAEMALAANGAEQASAKAQRDAALLDANANDLARAEKTYATTRETNERVQAVRDQLRSRLAAAEHAEERGIVEAAREEAEKRSKQLGEWWVTRGPEIFAEAQRGLELLRAAEEAGTDWKWKSAAAERAGHGPFERPADRAGSANSWMHALADACVQGNFEDLSQIRPAAPRAA